MKTNNNNSYRIRRAKRTLLGKILCRLAGEETGAVMMEYVIVAVMIAAAVALGAYFFGETILDMFGIAAKATDGRHSSAAADLVTERGTNDGRRQTAEGVQRNFSDSTTRQGQSN